MEIKDIIKEFIKEHNCEPTISDAIEATRKEIADELFNDLKQILPKHVFLSFDGILMIRLG